MADLTKSLLDAISIIADKTVDEISSDETIKAAIKKIVNTSEGKYLVNYNNGDFYAYKQSGSTDLYQVGEYVYILIPKGDMSQKKFIIGRVEDDKKYSAFKTLTSSLLNDYVIIGDNAIIGAGSVVVKDIPNDVLAYGNPCKVIRQITEEDRLTEELFLNWGVSCGHTP